MNLLYLAHRIPYPPDKGDKIRAFHQIRRLAARHRVHLACLVDEHDDLRHVPVLERLCASVEVVYRSKFSAMARAGLALVTGDPLSVAASRSWTLARRIRRRLALERIDRIVVFSSAMAWYVRRIRDIPTLMDFVDVDAEKWRTMAQYESFPRSWLARVEADRLARHDERVARDCLWSVFVSEREAALFRSRVGGVPVAVVPNGVDLGYFHPARRSDPPEPLLLFTGVMDYFPNVDAVAWFCERVLPSIRRLHPAAHFEIVGRNPTRRVRELGRHPGVTVTGSVPDVRPYLLRAALAVAPLRIARGVQNKVLEAMAMGLPVVGTSTAFQGIYATAADGVRVADDPEEFARSAAALLGDAEERRRCGALARRFVERHHVWDDQITHFESLLARTHSPVVLRAAS